MLATEERQNSSLGEQSMGRARSQINSAALAAVLNPMIECLKQGGCHQLGHFHIPSCTSRAFLQGMSSAHGMISHVAVRIIICIHLRGH